jgi:hypothetical protein
VFHFSTGVALIFPVQRTARSKGAYIMGGGIQGITFDYLCIFKTIETGYIV